jgi:threonine dehydrogenase-like Zn-dependent dehydrogenase
MVRVRMTAARMCGTDLNLHEGQFLANFPLAPGHETIGEIDVVGAAHPIPAARRGIPLLADPNEFTLAVASSLADIGTFTMDRHDITGSMRRLLSRNGARIDYYGVADENDVVQIAPFDVFRRELTIMGSFTEVDSFPDALAAFRAEVIRTEGLITHRFSVQE